MIQSMVLKFSNLFLILAALAVPLSQLGACLVRGEDIQPQLSSGSPLSDEVATCKSMQSNPEWAGAQCISQSVDSFNLLTATFRAPSVRDDTVFDGGVRIGIVLGNLTCSSIVLVGIQIVVSNKTAYYYAVSGSQFEDVTDFTPYSRTISPGDKIKVTVYASMLVGLAILENLTRHWMVHAAFHLPDSSTCLRVAQWVVQDYKEDKTDTYVFLAEFDTVLIYNAVFATGAPDTIETCTPSPAHMCDIEREAGFPLTTTWMLNGGMHIDWSAAGSAGDDGMMVTFSG